MISIGFRIECVFRIRKPLAYPTTTKRWLAVTLTAKKPSFLTTDSNTLKAKRNLRLQTKLFVSRVRTSLLTANTSKKKRSAK